MGKNARRRLGADQKLSDGTRTERRTDGGKTHAGQFANSRTCDAMITQVIRALPKTAPASERSCMMRRLVLLSCCVLLTACATSRQMAPPTAQTQRNIVPAPPAVGEPGDLAGLNSNELRGVVGPPSLVRNEGGR